MLRVCGETAHDSRDSHDSAHGNDRNDKPPDMVNVGGQRTTGFKNPRHTVRLRSDRRDFGLTRRLENLEHPRVAERVGLHACEVEELRNTFIGGAHELGVHFF